MIETGVLVVFYSRYGETEKLALAAGVGAIQMRAKIRLRRLADLASPEMIQSDAAWSANLERMKQDYIAPREIDARWAHVVILAAPAGRTAEMEEYLNAAREPLRGKIGAVIGAFSPAAVRAGLIVVPGVEAVHDAESARAYGRLATEMAIRANAERADNSGCLYKA